MLNVLVMNDFSAKCLSLDIMIESLNYINHMTICYLDRFHLIEIKYIINYLSFVGKLIFILKKKTFQLT